MSAGRVVAYGATSAPSGWLLCDGASYLRADYPALFAAIGTTYGAPDSTHFKVPDLRDRFVLGRTAGGTGSALGETGGSLQHTHAGPTHSHGVTPPSAHTAHVVTQPSAHATLTHDGFDLDDHPLVTHSSISVSNHTVNTSNAHGTHDSAGGHTHDSHDIFSVRKTGSGSYLTGPTNHSSDGSHNHDSHSAHNEKVNPHTVTGQTDNHPSVAHVVTQANDHVPTHSNLGVDAHGAHTGMVVSDVSAATSASDPAYIVVTFIIATAVSNAPAGIIVPSAGAAVPADHVLCDGQSLLRASYPDLFAVIGTTFGSADGTHFNVPDIRGRHLLGKSAATSVAGTGGSSSHNHTGGAHAHDVTQPGDHNDHVITQASSHVLVHSGMAVANHASASHSGFSVTASHNVTQSDGHGTHATDMNHNHNAHTSSTGRGAGTDVTSSPSSHSNEGGHSHNSHTAHSGADLNNHSVSQANAHSAATHTVAQPGTHTLPHTGAALTGHDSHASAAVNSGGAALSGSTDVPYIGLHHVIRTVQSVRPIGTMLAIGMSAAPAGMLLCDGTSVLRATYPDLFTAIGTTYGSVDGTHFSVPDLRGRIPRGAGGTGPALAATGGALDHTHSGPSHTHTTVQPGAHADHAATQPDDHGPEEHTGGNVTNDHVMSHSGAGLADHNPSQANNHTAHTTAGSHNHDSHSRGGAESLTIGSFVSSMTTSGAHSTVSAHTHTGAHSHSGFSVSDHSVTQPSAHTREHTGATQPDEHTFSDHAGWGVNAHSAHSGFATIADGTGTTGAANPPYVAMPYAIQALDDIEVHGVEFVVQAASDGSVTITTEEFAVPNTPPSSPIIFILEPPS